MDSSREGAMERTRIVTRAVWILALGLGAGACSDGPSGPTSRASVLEPGSAQSGQTAPVGSAVAVAPAVLVRDGRGLPAAGVPVTFRVTQGGGSLATPSATTDAEGMASAGEWRLGPLSGVNVVVAEVSGLRAVEFTATGVVASTPPTQGPATGAFDITIRYVSDATVRQRQAVDQAVARWRAVITGDLPSVNAVAPAGACFETQPEVNEVIDDILIFVEFKDIDGPGKILGEAGPCYVRTGSGLPVIGQLRLDAADLLAMERAGTLDDVVTHELGHVLGFGTLWKNKDLLTGSGTSDPQFSGSYAHTEYKALGGTLAGVPVENTGSTGTRDSHWRESVFGNELMTGYISGVPNPLSSLTAASLRDLGYQATTAGANDFALGGLLQQQYSLREPLDLRTRERVLRPQFEMDPYGRRTRLGDVDR
jgi:hypothetical protein